MRNTTTAQVHDPSGQSETTDLKRRRFLLTLGAGGAGAAVAAANVLPCAAAAPSAAVPSDENDAAYRETDHVRDYYRTIKI
jgi:hypothetical protein